MQKTTKRVLTVSALALGLINIATTADAAIGTTGIAKTRHNLGSSNRDANGLTLGYPGGARQGDLYTDGSNEICVFCHTPHGANSDAVLVTMSAPLWNRAVPTSTYTVYSSGTMQGTSTMTGASLLCLSCHDGTQAMDNLINHPGGSGYYPPNGQRLSPSTWYAGTGLAEGADTLSGKMAPGAGIVMLGTDLSNDHPVGIPYCGGGQAAPGSNAGCSDPDFNGAVDNGSGTGFMVGTDSVQKNNMRLYGASVGSATVECASCHDPHNEVNKTFLRINNVGSAVCLTCHTK